MPVEEGRQRAGKDMHLSQACVGLGWGGEGVEPSLNFSVLLCVVFNFAFWTDAHTVGQAGLELTMSCKPTLYSAPRLLAF